MTGIEPACPAWEVQNRQFADLPKSGKCLIRCRMGYPFLSASNRQSLWRGARLGARSACPVHLAGPEVPTRSEAMHRLRARHRIKNVVDEFPTAGSTFTKNGLYLQRCCQGSSAGFRIRRDLLPKKLPRIVRTAHSGSKVAGGLSNSVLEPC